MTILLNHSIFPQGTVGALLERMKTELTPKGTELLVRLELANHGFVAQELVQAAIAQFEHVILTHPLGGPLNGLERLGMALLLGSVRDRHDRPAS